MREVRFLRRRISLIVFLCFDCSHCKARDICKARLTYLLRSISEILAVNFIHIYYVSWTYHIYPHLKEVGLCNCIHIQTLNIKANNFLPN